MEFIQLNQNKSRIVKLITTFVIIIIIYSILTCCYKDKFSIDNIEIKLIKKNDIRIGVLVKLNKKYVSSSNSERLFFCGSREKGLFGLERSDFDIKIFDDKNNNITEFFIDENNFLNQNKSLNIKEFIEDMKCNKKYISGQKFANDEIYFWLDEYSEYNTSEVQISFNYKNVNSIIKIDEKE